MRIGLFTDTYPPFINGVSTSVQMLKTSLEKQGHQVFVVTVNPENMKYVYEDNNKVIRVPGIPVGIYDYRLTGIYPLRAINIIKKWKLDIIHSHTEFGVGTFARIVAKQLSIPLVHTYHTMYEDYVHYVTKGYFDKSSKKIAEYITLFYCDKTASELIVPTKKTYNLFKEKYHVDRNIHIVPTGIEIERFFDENIDKNKLFELKNDLCLNDDSFNLLFVGRLAQEKNIEYLLDVMKDLSKKHKDINLIIVGDGPDFDKYKELCNKYGISDQVIMTGKVAWDKIPLYYHLADLFVTASVTETQGLTVIEAMAASVPPVCINDDSFTSTIVDGLNGRIFKNKKELKNIILDLKKDNLKLHRMKRQARINSEIYSSTHFAESILNVYKYALGNKKTHSLFENVIDKIRGRE